MMPSKSTIMLMLVFCMQAACSQKITQNKTGNNNGFFYSFWNDHTNGKTTMTLKPGGRYLVKWTNIGIYTAGIGWSTGKEDRVICYSGKFNGGSNGYLAVYG